MGYKVESLHVSVINSMFHVVLLIILQASTYINLFYCKDFINLY